MREAEQLCAAEGGGECDPAQGGGQMLTDPEHHTSHALRSHAASPFGLQCSPARCGPASLVEHLSAHTNESNLIVLSLLGHTC